MSEAESASFQTGTIMPKIENHQRFLGLLAGVTVTVALLVLGLMLLSYRISGDCVETIQRIDPGPVVCEPKQQIEMIDHDHGIVVCRCRVSW